MRETGKKTPSREEKKSAHRLSGHERAVDEYLKSLLLEIDDEAISLQDLSYPDKSVVIEPVNENSDSDSVELPHEDPLPIAPVLGLEQLVTEIPDTIVETVNEPEIQQETQVEVQPEVQPEASIPEWGQTEFQCLLFKVSGLSLAVPLVKLKSVIAWDEGITQTPNQTQWYLGLVRHLEHQIKVIDTALLVMPENYREKIEADPAERSGHILLVDDYKWGLACDSIGEVIWLKPEDVKWRKNKTSRAWLSGTSLEHLCAIMDTEVFAQMLDEA